MLLSTHVLKFLYNILRFFLMTLYDSMILYVINSMPINVDINNGI